MEKNEYYPVLLFKETLTRADSLLNILFDIFHFCCVLMICTFANNVSVHVHCILVITFPSLDT